MLDKMYIDRLIMTALKEDMPMGDITTDSLIAPSAASRAQLIAKEEGVIAGLDIVKRTFAFLDEDIKINLNFKDGDFIKAGQIIGDIEGNTRAILKAERTALNFLQRLSGIATKTREFCEKIKDLPAAVVDTRKTTCGLRVLEKYAVRAGGGQNHRFCLSDGVLIKDNHIRAAGGIKKAVETARGHIPHTIKIEVETETIDQVNEALEAKAEIIMLDNMKPETMKEAVKLINKRALVEASGNISLDNIYDIAALGVDIISVGSLTHTVRALDISLRFV